MKETKLENFENKIKELYPNNFENIIKLHYINRDKTFRVNLLKGNEEEVIVNLKKEGFEILKLEFANTYSSKSSATKKLSESTEYLNNRIYIQEASSMIPVFILNPKESEKILDLCAAPGSKTSLIQNLANNKAEVVAIEKNKSRFFKMQKILEGQGVQNVKTIMSDANKLPYFYKNYINYFDKVLIDAPCTTEGNINLNDKDSLKEWHSSSARKISKLQKGLLNTALKLVKPGGEIVYSTCTYRIEENEEVINWILKKRSEIGDLKLEKVDLNLRNVQLGIIEWKGKALNPDIVKTIRILPNENYSAFFVAKLRKTGL